MSRSFYYTRKSFQDSVAIEKNLQANLGIMKADLESYANTNGLMVVIEPDKKPWRLNLFWRCRDESRGISQLTGQIYQFLLDFIKKYDNFFLHFSPMQADLAVLVFEFRVDNYDKFMLLHFEEGDQDLYFPIVTR